LFYKYDSPCGSAKVVLTATSRRLEIATFDPHKHLDDFMLGNITFYDIFCF